MPDVAEYERIRQLPVIRELERVYGAPPFDHLSGAPVTLTRTQMVRMPWVWFVAGRNFNLAVDYQDGRWQVRAGGHAGHVHATLGAGERVTHTMLRAVAVAAGLLDYPSVQEI
jgi:hypothetical protein